jgi:DNA helicase IV
MTDIVATIQAEQDRIIRAPLNQVTVVQGGPGTGKTAVALHRAAYLLYTHRRRLGHSGVLVVGPSQAFLHYIDQVLPSLGETGVLSRTMATLLPGITVGAVEDPFAAQLKGDICMAKVVANAVASRVRVPAELPTVHVNGVHLRISAADIEEAQQAARRTHLPHNRARVSFVEHMLESLVQRYSEQLDYTPEAAELGRVRDDLRYNDSVKKTLNLAWLPLNAEWLIADMWAKPAHLRRYAPWLDDTQIGILHRSKGSSWTAADVPLLDEAMELIGDDPRKIAADAAAPTTTDEERYAKDTLESMGISSSLVSAQQLAHGMEASEDDDLLSARAAKDRTWTYGHVVIDEAQELTRMDWRMLIRRCPSRSFTIVGDVAQTSALGGARSWNTMLDPVFGHDRWHLGELTIDYRNPQEVADLAADFARSEGLYISTVKAVREVEGSVSRHVVPHLDELVGTTVTEILGLVRHYLSDDGTGRIAVIADDELLSTLRAPLWNAVRSELGDDELHRLQSQADGDDQIDLTNPEGIKGLEYDAVLLVQPGLIEENSPNRLTAASDLFVSLTRPTQQLVIVRTRGDEEELPL